MTGFIESFKDSQQLEELRMKLGMKYTKADTNCKIWAFIDEIVEYEIVRDEEKMINFKLKNQGLGIEVMISLVYVNCTQSERLQSWNLMSNNSNLPWLVGGDFDVISTNEEKLRGRPVTEMEVRDFNHCLNVCNLKDKKKFKGSKYTWWNSRTDTECIFKRLDTGSE